ncbi:homoserine O-acetyltransferase [Bacillus sp. SB49]|uniref:homoserine O-acetyltransferase MetX n=1 Tax=Bacillus sp. SB49 TaxID=1071080 RepID=UPI00041900A7|nr:homoserine O-acetyltransferase [Bacillus sp. SB49]QHT48277.1 homoserine O-acetyltransferase [Bacillus sp. SB49]
MSLKNPVSQETESPVLSIGPLELESGDRLTDVELAYERYGKADAPVILVCHALTGNQLAVGSKEEPGWWAGLIGDDCPIDTKHYQVITFNVLGGCHGSTGPASINPDTGKEYKQTFPPVTIRDMVNAQFEALRRLGIQQLEAVVGGSLGGMQAYEWGLLYPTFMKKLFILAATPYLSDYGIAFNHIGSKAICSDPAFNGGNYESNTALQGFEIARMTGMVTYRSGTLFQQRFDRSQAKEDRYDIQSYLDHQGAKIKERFDANSYLYLLEAMNNHDIGKKRGGWEAAATLYEAPIYTISFEHDLLYPESLIARFSALAPQAEHYHVTTDFGHDGFLVEFERWGQWIKEKLDT